VPLGTVISWLFALPGNGGKNGFGLTGGVLNYTAEVYYPDTGEKATLVFQFKVWFLSLSFFVLIYFLLL
jgi:hypothetical protein